ncbi:hypothetical protein LIA77_03945 [Sarocladium implicatum]|nr:hypothetical protein LIA77_03945 [Sarocladium implicatum]
MWLSLCISESRLSIFPSVTPIRRGPHTQIPITRNHETATCGVCSTWKLLSATRPRSLVCILQIVIPPNEGGSLGRVTKCAEQRPRVPPARNDVCPSLTGWKGLMGFPIGAIRAEAATASDDVGGQPHKDLVIAGEASIELPAGQDIRKLERHHLRD